jgi:dinuclear metal center YbgI/SA1388 family protein
MVINDIIEHIERISPPKLAQDWDNVGLLVGSRDNKVSRILLTIDITQAVLREAISKKIQLIISYHPVIWDGLKNIRPDNPQSSLIYELIRANIAVYSIHTSLDVVNGGVNDGLAEIIGIENPQPLGDYVQDPDKDNYKFIVFVPKNSLNKVANAIFNAGAGAIGNYSKCSFRTEGQGTFLPMDGSNPAIGKKGQLEFVDEIKLESIVPAPKIRPVIEAMRKAHPYEEPAFDTIKLSNVEKPAGLGRIGKLEKPKKIKDIITLIKNKTKAQYIGIIGPQNKTAHKAALCAGSCGKLINQAITKGCDLYLTGELKHHLALAAAEANMTTLCLSHTVSERFILQKLLKQLKKQLPQLKISVSSKDKDPFVWKQL